MNTLLVLVLLARLRRRHTDLAAAVGLAAALGVHGGVKQACKRASARTRPGSPGTGSGGSSFPSGHASLAAFCAVLLSGGAASCAAAAVCGSRVASGRHHPSDVVAGAALGAILATVARRGLPILRTGRRNA